MNRGNSPIDQLSYLNLMKKYALALTLAAVFCLTLLPSRTDDLFMTLSLGRRFLELRSFGDTDPFLFTLPDYHWHLWHEWLSYLIYYSLYLISGFQGIVLLKASLSAMGAAMVWKAGARFGLPPLIPLIITIASLGVAFPRISERSSLFSDLLSCLVLFVLTAPGIQDYLRNGKLKWFFAGVFLIWTQLHPGFPVGWLLLLLFILINFRDWNGRERREALLTLLLCMGIGVVNPIGIEGLFYPFKKFFSPEWNIFRAINSEWQRTLIASYLPLGYKIFLLGYISTVLMTAGFSGGSRKQKLFPLLAVLLLAYLGLSGARFLALAGLGLGILWGSFLGQSSSRWHAFGEACKGRKAAAASLLLPLAAFLFSLSSNEFGPRLLLGENVVAGEVPVEEVRLFKKLPPGNIFNEYEYGGLLVWELNGAMKIAAHGHIDSPALVMSRYFRFSYSPKDFNEIIYGGDVQYFLVKTETLRNNRGAGFVQELLGPRWEVILSNDRVTILQNRGQNPGPSRDQRRGQRDS
jgi:hypothetical protein